MTLVPVTDPPCMRCGDDVMVDAGSITEDALFRDVGAGESRRTYLRVCRRCGRIVVTRIESVRPPR